MQTYATIELDSNFGVVQKFDIAEGMLPFLSLLVGYCKWRHAVQHGLRARCRSCTWCVLLC